MASSWSQVWQRASNVGWREGGIGRRIVKSSQARVVFHERGSARQGCKPEGQDSVGQVQGIEAMAKADR